MCEVSCNTHTTTIRTATHALSITDRHPQDTIWREDFTVTGVLHVWFCVLDRKKVTASDRHKRERGQSNFMYDVCWISRGEEGREWGLVGTRQICGWISGRTRGLHVQKSQFISKNSQKESLSQHTGVDHYHIGLRESFWTCTYFKLNINVYKYIYICLATSLTPNFSCESSLFVWHAKLLPT